MAIILKNYDTLGILGQQFGKGVEAGVDEAYETRREDKRRKKVRAEEIGEEYGPEAYEQALAGTFPGKAAKTAEKLEQEETETANVARALGYNMETVTPGRWKAPPTPASPDELHEPEYIEETRTPIKRLPKSVIPLLAARERAAAKAPSTPNTPFEAYIRRAQQSFREPLGSQPSARALEMAEGLRMTAEKDLARQRTEGRDIPVTRPQMMQWGKDYERDPVTQNFLDQKAAYSRLEALGSAGSPMSDRALIYQFVRTNDPGSMVHHTETKGFSSAAPLDQRLRLAYNHLIAGRDLEPKMIADIQGVAKRMFASAVQNQEEMEADFKRRGSGMGYLPSDIPDVIGRYRSRPGKEVWQSKDPGFTVRRKP